MMENLGLNSLVFNTTGLSFMEKVECPDFKGAVVHKLQVLISSLWKVSKIHETFFTWS